MMKNHYHLLVYTPKDNLSQGRWCFGRQFSLKVNREINGDGALFKDRFRSIMINEERYFLQLSRYIHLNSVEAGLVKQPELYTWSSCSYSLTF